MSWIWLCPYLPLQSEVSIGQWQLVPFDDFRVRHARDRAIGLQTKRLITSYKLRDVTGRFGAVVVPADGRVGDEISAQAMASVERAVAAALVDSNPLLGNRDEADPNAAHRMTTPDNAHLVGHRADANNHLVVIEGAMVERLDLRAAPPGRPLSKVAPPPYVPTPLMGLGVDEEYADALYRALTADNGTARRLDRCIQWLLLAWTNVRVVGEDARILAYRSGFEVLLGGGSGTKKHGTALAGLLQDRSKRRLRHWEDRGRPRAGELNATEWWFQSFALLRNAIAHGDEIPSSQWWFRGSRHLWIADRRLRRAIKRTVVAGGADPDLEIERPLRTLQRAYRELDSK